MFFSASKEPEKTADPEQVQQCSETENGEEGGRVD